MLKEDKKDYGEYLEALRHFLIDALRFRRRYDDVSQSWTDHEDFVQETLLIVNARLTDPESDEKWLCMSYVKQVLLNDVKDYFKSCRTQKRGGDKTQEPMPAELAILADFEGEDSDQVEDLRACMSRGLSVNERLVIRSRYYCDVDDDVVARLLDIAVRSVHDIRSEAYRKLRECVTARLNSRSENATQ